MATSPVYASASRPSSRRRYSKLPLGACTHGDRLHGIHLNMIPHGPNTAADTCWLPLLPPKPPQPSVWDLLAAPTVFLQQALVYRETLDSTALAAAIQQAVDLYPAFASRVTKDQVLYPWLFV